MNEWFPNTLSVDYDGFQRFLIHFCDDMRERIGSVGRHRTAYSSPTGSARIDGEFGELNDHIATTLARVFPDVVVGQMRQSLLAYRSVADWALPQIAHLLRAQTQCEAWMYSDLENEYYREHFVHPLAVTYIGVKMLEQSEVLDRVVSATFTPRDQDGPMAHFWRHMSERGNQPEIDNTLKPEIIWAAWYVAAVCHDMAQSYDLVNMVDRAFVRVRWWGLEQSPPHDLSDHLDGHLWWEYLRWAVRDKHAPVKRDSLDPSAAALMGSGPAEPRAAWRVIQQHSRRNHSTICAMWVQMLGDDVARLVQGHPETKWLIELVYELAAAAVLTHDWVDAENVYAVDQFCDPQRNPLGQVLLTSDLLEGWARPYRRHLPSRRSMSYCKVLSEYVYPFAGVSVEPRSTTDTAAPRIVVTRYEGDALAVGRLCSVERRRGRRCPMFATHRCPHYTPRHKALLDGTLDLKKLKGKCHLIHFENQFRSFVNHVCADARAAAEDAHGRAPEFVEFHYDSAPP